MTTGGIIMQINNCTAIVTGGASGLGEACVKHIISQGGNAAIFDLDDIKALNLVKSLEKNIIFCKTDVSNEESVESSIQKTIETFEKIHFVINCAGIGTPQKILGKNGPVSLDYLTKVIQINLIGSLNVIRLASEQIVKNNPNEDGERGVIINTSSIAAYDGQVGQAAYSASKAGIIGMTLPIAKEFARHGIRVLTIAPGLFDTPMFAGLPEKAIAALIEDIPFPKRLGKPSEFAGLVGHIIENPVLNGETIRLDCSMRMK